MIHRQNLQFPEKDTALREDVHRLPVVSNGHLDGVLSRANILRFLETRAELGI